MVKSDARPDKEVITMQRATKDYKVIPSTLRKWADGGFIPSMRSPYGVRLFRRKDLDDFFSFDRVEAEVEIEIKQNIVYCRVSSIKQRDDLDRQVAFLRRAYPDHRVVSDICSGINFNRKGLGAILDLCNQKKLGEVVVAHKDRLCRFGYDLLEQVIKRAGGRIVMHEDTPDEPKFKTNEQELAEDLLAIVHVFNCRQLGKRRYRTRNTENAQGADLPRPSAGKDD
jgi:predicted site-specific integrase-resolvase